VNGDNIKQETLFMLSWKITESRNVWGWKGPLEV